MVTYLIVQSSDLCENLWILYPISPAVPFSYGQETKSLESSSDLHVKAKDFNFTSY